MDKKSLVSFVRASLLKRESHSDDQRQLHYKRVEQAVGYAFDTLLSQIPLTAEGKAKIESLYVKNYYNQPVLEGVGYRYFGVSDDVVSMERPIWYVQPTGGGRAFAHTSRPSHSIFSNMAVGEVVNDTFWRFGNLADKRQIILENSGDSPFKDVRNVDYGIVRSFSSYGDDEEVVPPDNRMDLLEQMCMAWLQSNPTTPANDNV